MNMSLAPPDILLQLAKTSDVTWSIATFGAIAEFSYMAGEEAMVSSDSNGFGILTPRGALRYDHASNAKIIAYEGLSKNPALWSQGVSICLPEVDACLNARSVLTENESDSGALKADCRNERLFDIGVGAPHVDAFVRTTDRHLTSILQNHTGKPLFDDHASDALHVILMQSPDRVFVSSLGRIEVRTPISHEDGETETGPHTHVLPDLLASGRTHAANVPIPDGYLSCMNIFPPNPARDNRGDPRCFDRDDHILFQDILLTYGDPTGNAIKRQVRSLIAGGEGPESLARPENGFSRIERTALRVALRQLRFTTGNSPLLDQWISIYEPNNELENK